MSRPRLPLLPSRSATRRLFVVTLLAGAGVSACSSSPLHPVDGGAGSGGAAGHPVDAVPNGQPACRVIDQSAAGYTVAQTVMPNCSDNGNAVPCWTAVDDSATCGTGKRLTVNPGPTTLASSFPPHYFASAFTCDPCTGPTEIGCN